MHEVPPSYFKGRKSKIPLYHCQMPEDYTLSMLKISHAIANGSGQISCYETRNGLVH